MGMGEGDNKPEHRPILLKIVSVLVVNRAMPGTLWSAVRCSKAQAQMDDMANDLLDKIPDWLKSLWHMENELRNAARNGLILRKDEASAHLAEARRHLEKAMNEAKGIEPANGPQTPLRKEGEV
jgi:hypothetical protein